MQTFEQDAGSQDAQGCLAIGRRVVTNIDTCSMWTPPVGSLGTIVAKEPDGWQRWGVEVDGVDGQWMCLAHELSAD